MGGRRRIIEGDLELGFGHDNKINQRGGFEKYHHERASWSFSVRVGRSLAVLDYVWS